MNRRIALAAPLVLATKRADALVIDLTLEEIVEQATLIVIASVAIVENGFAALAIEEALKGEAISSPRVCLGRRFGCDISGAQPGDRALFLLEPDRTHDVGSSFHIAHYGRGRMDFIDVEHVRVRFTRVRQEHVARRSSNDHETILRLDTIRRLVLGS